MSYHPPTFLQVGEFESLYTGTAFPSDPFNGMEFTRSDHLGGTKYVYNDTISKWLGPVQEHVWGETDTTVNNQYLRQAGRSTAGVNRGYFMMWAVRIVAVTAVWNVGVTAGIVEIHRNNVLVTTLPHPGGTVASFKLDTFMDAFAIDGAMQCFFSSFNVAVSIPTATCFWRREEAP